MIAGDLEIVAIMTTATRRRMLEQAGLLHSRPEAVSAPLFDGREPFFLALDKVQVKYEMLRTHIIDGRAPDALLLEVFTGAGCGTMIVGRKEKATYLGVDLAG